MQCFICVTYMMLMTTALPPAPIQQRSLFQDVINSLKIRSHLSENLAPYNENKLTQNYESYQYEGDTDTFNLPSDGDAQFVPRRNDRIEMPSLNRRLPKSFTEHQENVTGNDDFTNPKEEVVLYITTETQVVSTKKPPSKRTTKRPRPSSSKNKIKNKISEELGEEQNIDDSGNVEDLPSPPLHNNMSGQSQIGNRESQIVVKPTVIVNFRGTISHRDSDIRLEGRRKNEENSTEIESIPQNVFNINQEINLERTIADLTSRRGSNKKDCNKDNAKEIIAVSDKSQSNVILSEDVSRSRDNYLTVQQQQIGRSVDNVFEILVSV